jgi:hypothetical protein
MSDNENPAPTPSKQTSSVPLKKETVRVTLKAADAPAVPSSTVPLAPPVRPPVPGGAPRPPAPVPTVALKPAGAPGAPAPTIRLATSSTPLTPASPTVPLKPAGATPTLPGATPALPKATVQLKAPTAPLGATSTAQLAPKLEEEEEEEESTGEGLINILAGVGFAAALLVLVFQLMLANVWIGAEDNDQSGDWSQLIQ